VDQEKEDCVVMPPGAERSQGPAFRFDVLTLFPEIFQGYLTQSLLKLALQKGGGPGMVLMCEPIYAAIEAVRQKAADPGLLVMLTPTGERLTQPLVRDLATQQRRLLLLCGRYEGFDERIRQGLQPREVSIGDFVCNGGEVPAMVVIDTVVRYVPGVLGDPDSLVEESHNDPGRLEYPQYTRPRTFRGMAVPEVLMSGDHQAVARWRAEQSLARTRRGAGQLNEPIDPRKEGEGHEEPIDHSG
jgi:tRNA (guanine37-N1)-methyltransferase